MSHPRPNVPRSTGGFGLRRPARAFTLLEMVVVITIIAIIAGSLVPVITRPYVTEKRLETVSEMGAIEEAIIGRYEYGDPGFLGTIGGLPTSVQQLVTQGTLHLATTQPSTGPQVGVPFGWNGPYIKSEFEDPTMDAWGSPYTITPNCNGHDPTSWSLQSPGPDKVLGTTDDFVFPATASGNSCFSSQGFVFVEIDEGYGVHTTPAPAQDLVSAAPVVQMWYPLSPQNGAATGQGGLPTSATCGLVTGTLSTYQCPSSGTATQQIPFGLPVVQVNIANSSKFSQIPQVGGVTVYYQVIPHHRANTYQKVVIPVSSVNASTTAATPVNQLALTGTSFPISVPINSTGVTVASLSAIPTQTTGTTLTVTMSGTLTISDGGVCAVVPQAILSGSFFPPVTATPTATTLEALTQYGAWAQPGTNTTGLFFTATYAFQVPAGTAPAARFQAYSSSGSTGSCQITSAGVNYQQVFTAP